MKTGMQRLAEIAPPRAMTMNDVVILAHLLETSEMAVLEAVLAPGD